MSYPTRYLERSLFPAPVPAPAPRHSYGSSVPQTPYLDGRMGGYQPSHSSSHSPDHAHYTTTSLRRTPAISKSMGKDWHSALVPVETRTRAYNGPYGHIYIKNLN